MMEKGLLDCVDMLSISPSRIVKYKKYEQHSTGCYMPPRMPISNKSDGIISSRANRKVQHIIDWMVLLAIEKTNYNPKYKSYYKWKLNFVTLTLCQKQKHTDKEIKELLLMPFLNWVRKSYKPKMYFWRAETQENGNIHFHIIFDVFIPWQIIQMKWNLLQNDNGYESFSNTAYLSRQANGTDVHSLKNINKVAAYLSKYCGKNSKGITMLLSKTKLFNMRVKPLYLVHKFVQPSKDARYFRPVYGRLWSCSENLSKLINLKCEMTYAMKGEISAYATKNPSAIVHCDFVDIWRCDFTKDMYKFMPSITELVVLHCLKQDFMLPEIVPLIAN